MTRTRAGLIAILSLLVVYLYHLAAAGRDERERDALLLSMDPDGAYALGRVHGINGIAGYWPERPRMVEDSVPGVGSVPRESTEYRAYWHGYEKGQEERDE